MFKKAVQQVIKQNKKGSKVAPTKLEPEKNDEITLTLASPLPTPIHSSRGGGIEKEIKESTNESEETEKDLKATDNSFLKPEARVKKAKDEKKPEEPNVKWIAFVWTQRIIGFIVTLVIAIRESVESSGSRNVAESFTKTPNTVAVDLKTALGFSKPFGDVFIRLSDNRFGFIDDSTWGINEV